MIGDHAALVGNGFESERLVGDGDFHVCATAVPAELFNEERLEIKIFQMLFDVVENSGHVAIRG